MAKWDHSLQVNSYQIKPWTFNLSNGCAENTPKLLWSNVMLEPVT